LNFCFLILVSPNLHIATGSTSRLSDQGQPTAAQHNPGYQAPFVVPNAEVYEEERGGNHLTGTMCLHLTSQAI
jgi:hypothetical protein